MAEHVYHNDRQVLVAIASALESINKTLNKIVDGQMERDRDGR